MNEYKRLTKREDDGNIAFLNENGSWRPFVLNGELAQKMGRRLAELEDDIENGTLVKLPCRVGDIVYRLHLPAKEIKEWEVEKVIITNKSISFELGRKGTDDYAFFYDYELGHYYFLDIPSRFNVGDKVVSNGKYKDIEQGKVYTVIGEQTVIGGSVCVWLDQGKGCFCADGLTLFNDRK